VFIPCYRYADVLVQCVESVLSQDGVDVRVLVIDDCSPDNTPEVAAQLVAADSRVEYRRHASNIGHLATYNEGIEWADGDYCVLLSADDLLTPGALARATCVLQTNPQAGFVYGRALSWFSGSPAPVPATAGESAPHKVLPGGEWLAGVLHNGDNPICSPEVVVRTSLQHEVGGYRLDLPHTGDLEMWLRLATRADVAFVDADQAVYRLHGSNMNIAIRQSALAIEQIHRAFDIVLTEQATRIDNPKHLRKVANRVVARNGMGYASEVFDQTGSRREAFRTARYAIGLSPLWALANRRAVGIAGRLILGPKAAAPIRRGALRILRRPG
jgi:glycosyltransferase involved in cell wall biosynthesis